MAASFPVDAPQRAVVRREMRDKILADAERRIRQAGRSMKCAGWGGISNPRHAGQEHGCANDGTGCVCECHDQQRVEASSGH